MSAGFHEVSFPLALAFGSSGGPERRTEVVTLASGREERNQRWADSRRRYNVGSGVRSRADMERLIAFFEERRGRLYGFRFRDRSDFSSAPVPAEPGPFDQRIGTGDGETTEFLLVKRYGDGLAPWLRAIEKPVAGTIRVAVGGVEKGAGAFSLDAATGRITFSSGHVPAAGAAVTAGFLFDVPVRFDTDRLDIDLAAFEAGEAPSVPIVEIKP
ncbi:TIGR02217 family protein [Afifella sp. YEN Y35]|uniref:phage distal tail protein, Rcc01695 family n=1 Tax=Afifella sp. YEN Y35 TaxID=3388337 RepID=UPI0039E0C81C